VSPRSCRMTRGGKRRHPAGAQSSI
jgi:hypothetical protein